MTSQELPDDTERNSPKKKPLPARQWIFPDSPNENAPEGQQLDLFYHAKLFVGPIPPPDLLQEYAQVDKYLPERIITMAEREQAVRHAREDKEIEARATSGKRAHICATSIAICAMVCSVPIAIWGNPWAAGVIGFGGVVGHIIPVLLPPFKQSSHSRDRASDSE